MSERIPYTRPSITAAEHALVQDAVIHGWGPRCYEYIERFEREFAAHVGASHALATSSGTGALHLGLAALGVGPGDEVILADSNWVASVAPVVHLGARPVVVDVEPSSWCLDPDLVARAITPRTKAIIAVHLYGNVCAMDQLLDLGARHGLPIVEDAAEAIGSEWRGRRAGSLGRFGIFSFHGTKTLTTGEGGALVTSDGDLYERALTLSNHGRRRGEARQFWPSAVGYKFKMSNLQAALGCGQLARVEELVGRKREILAAYRSALGDLPGARLNPEPPGTRHGAWMPTIVFEAETGVTRERLQDAMLRANIDARVFFWPLSSIPALGLAADSPVANRLAAHAINLPSFHDMSEDQLARVVKAIREVARA